MATIDLDAILADLDRRIGDLQIARDAIARLISAEGRPTLPPPQKQQPAAKGKAPKAEAKKRGKTQGSRYTDADIKKIRRIALENYELNPHQLKERFNLVPSAESIRQILLGKSHPDPDYDPEEWIALHKKS